MLCNKFANFLEFSNIFVFLFRLIEYFATYFDNDNNEFKYRDNEGKLKEGEILIIEKLDGDLMTLFDQCNKKFSDSTIINIAIDVLNGLAYLRKLGYIHKDLKPENLLFSRKDVKIKLCDFGLCECIVDEKGNLNEYKEGMKHNGNLRFMPYCTHKRNSIGFDADISSLFLILYWLAKRGILTSGLLDIR